MSSPIKAKIAADQQNNQEEMRPVVVRTLKDPPEIWDLVHETPAHFTPTDAFVARLNSSKRTLTLVMLIAILISGLAAFLFITRRDGGLRYTAAPQGTEGVATSTAGTSAGQANRPAENSQNGQVSPSPGAASVVDNTSLQPTTSTPTDSHSQSIVPSPDNAALAGTAPGESLQPTGMSEAQAQDNGTVVSNISKRTASRRRKGSGDNLVTVAAGGQTAENVSANTHNSQASKAVDLNQSYEKSSSETPSANKGSVPTLSPQLIAPPTATPAPKAKVIQWP